MSFDFAALKAECRQIVHDTLAVSALYSDKTLAEPVEVHVRFHTKINRFGDMLDQGWAEIVEGVNRIIFNTPELAEKAVSPINGGLVTLTAPGFEHISLVLHAEEPNSGPIERIFQVSQE